MIQDNRTRACVRIQKCFRNWFQSENPLYFVSNFFDRDILSLEGSRLRSGEVFFYAPSITIKSMPATAKRGLDIL